MEKAKNFQILGQNCVFWKFFGLKGVKKWKFWEKKIRFKNSFKKHILNICHIPQKTFFKKHKILRLFSDTGLQAKKRPLATLKWLFSHSNYRNKRLLDFFPPNDTLKHIPKYILSLISTFWVNCTSSLGAEAIVHYCLRRSVNSKMDF